MAPYLASSLTSGFTLTVVHTLLYVVVSFMLVDLCITLCYCSEEEEEDFNLFPCVLYSRVCVCVLARALALFSRAYFHGIRAWFRLES